MGNLTTGLNLREAFLQGLRDLGYAEGRNVANVAIEYRDAEGKLDRLPALSAELVALKVDVIVAGGGTAGALAVKQATRPLPIVTTGVGDPVAAGLVTSLSRPGKERPMRRRGAKPAKTKIEAKLPAARKLRKSEGSRSVGSTFTFAIPMRREAR